MKVIKLFRRENNANHEERSGFISVESSLLILDLPLVMSDGIPVWP